MKLTQVAPSVCAIAIATGLCGSNTLAQEPRHRHGGAVSGVPAPFIASTQKPFAALMADAMAVMNHGMESAPVTGVAESDFVTMMIPHHQGAIDMAKALLAHSSDAQLRNLAQGIITEQQNEIRVMQAWLQRHHATGRAAATPTKGDQDAD